jgi:ABC-type taurine transport system substrate-binding protein
MIGILLDWRFWLGAALVACVAIGAIQTARLGGCQDRLAASQQRVAILEDGIRQQNAAVDALKAAGDARVAEAAKVAGKAISEAVAARSEAERLRRAAAAAPEPVARPTGCPASGADRAVATVREWLR